MQTIGYVIKQLYYHPLFFEYDPEERYVYFSSGNKYLSKSINDAHIFNTLEEAQESVNIYIKKDLLGIYKLELSKV